MPAVMRIPSAAMRCPPRLMRSVAKDCIEIFMSLRSCDPPAVYRRQTCMRGALPSSGKSGLVRQVAHTRECINEILVIFQLAKVGEQFLESPLIVAHGGPGVIILRHPAQEDLAVDS